MGQITDAQRVFSDIYERNVWGKGSGLGSDPAVVVEYTDLLQRFLLEHKIRSVVDVGCGDWQFSQFVDWKDISYDGFDVVAPVVEQNRQKFGTPNIRFHHIADGTRLPAADLIVCKDVMQHLPTSVVRRYLKQFKRIAPHSLITNDIFPVYAVNGDIEPGAWRSIRLDLPPFNERIDVLLEWDIRSWGNHWIKQTCHMRGDLIRLPYVTLSDRLQFEDHLGTASRQALSLARRARDFVRRARAKADRDIKKLLGG